MHAPDFSHLLREELLQEIFEEQADNFPEHIALECAGEILSYREVDNCANQFARYLRSLGVGPGACVAFQLPRSSATIITLLAILKAGATYVPLDIDYPVERVSYILGDCGVKLLVKNSTVMPPQPEYSCPVLEWKTALRTFSRLPEKRLTRAETGATPDDISYIIYTSGSTGKPKGVQISHRSVCHLVRAEGEIFQLTPADRVYQGFSIAFDASVEEVWLAFAAGATLVVGTADMAYAGPALAGLLAAARVTVLSTVPTLLAVFEEQIPTLRLLILGGEQCPYDLVRRWATPALRMVNTYGPTEATVVATYTDCAPEKPVTIGVPLPNYQVYILDEARQQVAAGACGEIYIGGVGLARGYVGRADLTTAAFVDNPFGEGRLYRTGDLGCYNAAGDIEFMGRADSQVKLRGYRVELSEIEAALMDSPLVRAAAVAVREDTPGVQQLVAYLISNEAQERVEAEVIAHVRASLPTYMRPSIYEFVTEFPTLPSGKVDRKSLPAPRVRAATITADDEPRTPFEAKLMAAVKPFFAPLPITRSADFFLDLGGHSLLAARVVSALRHDADFHDISVIDIYHHHHLHELAATIAKRRTQDPAPEENCDLKDTAAAGQGNFALCGLAQLGGLYAIFGVIGLEWLVPLYVYFWLRADGTELLPTMLIMSAIMLGIYPALLLLALVVKWTVIGRYRAGCYPLWGGFYLRWWLVQHFISLANLHLLIGTPYLNWYLRLLGAKIGRDVYLGTDHLSSFDLITLGDGCSIGLEASLPGYTVAHGMLIIAPITIGDGCYVGPRAIVGGHAVMEAGARLESMSLLPANGRIPAGKTWAGSPARPQVNPVVGAKPADDNAPGALTTLAHLPGIILLQLFPALAAVPEIFLWFALKLSPGMWLLAAIPLLAALYIATFLLLVIAAKWLLLGRIRAGEYSLNSSFYVRKRIVDQLLDSCLVLLGPLYATLYITPFFRWLGASLGDAVEISTAHAVTPDLLQMASGGFIADSVALGIAHIEHSMMTLAATRIGQRTFIGNSATLNGGDIVGDNGLIGVLSTVPQSHPGAEKNGTSWLGSPAFFLPHRPINTTFALETTYAPTRKLYAQRYFIEFFRITLPMIFSLMITLPLLYGVWYADEYFTALPVILLYPLAYAAGGIIACAIVIAAKWLLMGRFQPTEKPLWSVYVWKNELLTALHEHLADSFLIRQLLGTPFACWFFRALGAKVGARVYIDTTSITEFDLVTIGDDVMLNQDCVVQTHLFEDRVMKMSTINIGTGCTIGSRAIVLYDSVLEPGATLHDLSLVMKGETLPAQTEWIGSPGRRVNGQRA